MSEGSGLRILAIDCSPNGPGRTGNALEALLAGAEAAGASTSLVHLGGEAALSPEAAVEAMGGADAFVFGSPIYRATYATPFKALVDVTPRGMWGESEAPLTGRATAILATGASDHHFLALGRMRDVLVDFFAAQVVSPGVYLAHASFGEDRQLIDDAAQRTRLQGLALVELADAVARSRGLRAVKPQV